MTNSAVAALGHEIWTWREATAFRTSDDIPRIDHDPGWLPGITTASVDARRARLAELRDAWAALDIGGLEVADRVDHRLLGSALARVTWELDVVRAWERDAVFAAGQALGPYYDLLLPVPPLGSGHQAGLIAALQAVPAQLAVAREHLSRAGWAPLARAAVELLAGIEETLNASVAVAASLVDVDQRDALQGAGRDAAAALDDYAAWLARTAPEMADPEPVGRAAFVWFLRHVALLPSEPEALVAAAEHEYHRAVVGEALARNRHRDQPLPQLPE